MITQFICSVEAGKLKIHDKIGFTEALKTYEGKNFIFAIRPIKELRSAQQNNYYWGVVLKLTAQEISNAMGKRFSEEHTHAYFKKEFLSEELEVIRDGKVFKIPRIKSTAELNKTEFGEYLDNIFEWALDKLGLTIPSSEEYYRDFDLDL